MWMKIFSRSFVMLSYMELKRIDSISPFQKKTLQRKIIMLIHASERMNAEHQKVVILHNDNFYKQEPV